MSKDLPSVKKHFAIIFPDTCIDCEKSFVRTTIWRVTIKGQHYYVCRECAKSANQAISRTKARLDGTKANTALISASAGSKVTPIRPSSIKPIRPAKHRKDSDDLEDLADDVIELGMMADLNTSVDPDDDSVPLDEPSEFTPSNNAVLSADTESTIVEDSSSYRSTPVSAPEPAPSIVEDNTGGGWESSDSGGGGGYDD